RSGSKNAAQEETNGGAGVGPQNAGYVPPKFLVRYKPPYPEEARVQHLEGTVLLLVSIDAEGHLTSTEIGRSCGHPRLDRAAFSAVQSWRFSPALQNGVPIATKVELPVSFKFEKLPPVRTR